MTIYTIIWNDFYGESYWDCEVAQTWLGAYNFARCFLRNFMESKNLPFDKEEAFKELKNGEFCNEYIHIEISAKTLL